MRSGVEYDRAKDAANRLKHGIDFAEAATCMEDPHAPLLEDHAEGEPRWLIIGRSDRGRLLTDCFTLRGDLARLISARKATSKEKADYER